MTATAQVANGSVAVIPPFPGDVIRFQCARDQLLCVIINVILQHDNILTSFRQIKLTGKRR